MFIFQLPAWSLRSPVASVNPYHFSWLEGGGWGLVVIGIVLVPELDGAHLAAGDFMDKCQPFSCGLGLYFFGEIGADNKLKVISRVKSMVCEERGHAGGVGGLAVGCRLGEEEVVRPVILEVADICPKVLFHNGVYPFGLSVSFRVECRREAWLNPQAVAQVLPESRCELGSSI